MAHGDVKHDYHLVNPSPWPFVASVGALIAAIGGVVLMRGIADEGILAKGQWYLFGAGGVILIFTCIGWWGDVIKESRQGDHTRFAAPALVAQHAPDDHAEAGRHGHRDKSDCNEGCIHTVPTALVPGFSDPRSPIST